MKLDNKEKEKFAMSVEKHDFRAMYYKTVDYDGDDDVISRNERFIHRQRQKQERHDKIRQEEEDNPPHSFKPKINEYSDLTRTVDDLYNWQKRKQANRKRKEEEFYRLPLKHQGLVSAKDVIIQDRFVQLTKDDFKAKSVSPIKFRKSNISERLYVYKQIYDDKKKEKKDKQLDGLFKPDMSESVKLFKGKIQSRVKHMVKTGNYSKAKKNWNKKSVDKPQSETNLTKTLHAPLKSEKQVYDNRKTKIKPKSKPRSKKRRVSVKREEQRKSGKVVVININVDDGKVRYEHMDKAEYESKKGNQFSKENEKTLIMSKQRGSFDKTYMIGKLSGEN